jgi:cytochrome b561
VPIRSVMRRLLHTSLTVTLFMLALAGGLVASTAVAGATEVGVNVAATSGNFFQSHKVIAALRESKPAWVRVFLGWDGLEPAQGQYNTNEIAAYARFFDKLPAGTKIDVDVEGSPAWANGGSGNPTTPPTNDADYAGFLNYLVNAFHGRVTAWEIWNEEDNTGWWSGSPVQYAALLKAAYPAIKSADPHATVIVGGLTGNDGAYLNQLYAAGAQGSFDVVGVHTDTACNIASPYSFEYNPGTHAINQYFFLGFISIHAAMVAAGDAAKPIYMTELGWSATSAECQVGHWAGQKAAGVSPQTQATYLKQAYHCLAEPQYSYVKAAMWFELFNDGTSSDPLDNFGLLDRNYVAKPAFAAFEQESLHGDQLSGPCGDFAPPAITILRPNSGATYRGALTIAVRASDPAAGVREITIQLSNHARFHFYSRRFAKTLTSHVVWNSAKALPPGPHKIRVVVTDKLGNVARESVVFMHGVTHASRRHRRHH